MKTNPITDFFGISTALKAILQVYFQACRRSGRTTQMIEALKMGDRIIFATSQEARRVNHLAKERGIEIECVVVPPDYPPHRICELSTNQGRTLFDHCWLEQYYVNSLQDAESEIDRVSQRLSGYDVRHRETRAKYAIQVSHLKYRGDAA